MRAVLQGEVAVPTEAEMQLDVAGAAGEAHPRHFLGIAQQQPALSREQRSLLEEVRKPLPGAALGRRPPSYIHVVVP